MKCRLIGDLETMSTIGRDIMNVSRRLPHVSQPVFIDGKPGGKNKKQKTQKQRFDCKMFFIPFTKSTKGSYLFFTVAGNLAKLRSNNFIDI